MSIPLTYHSRKYIVWVMDKTLSEYFAKNGKKGGKSRAAKGKKALSLIAKKGWATRKKRLEVLTATISTGSNE